MAHLSDPRVASDGSAGPMIPQIAHVRRRRRDGPDVWTLELELQQAPLPAFLPGQFNMLTVFGVGEVPISFSGDPADGSYWTHTIRGVGHVSNALLHLRKGDAVGLRGPFGSGWPMQEMAGRDVVVVAGGLGLAPLRPALYQLLHDRKRYGRIALIYGSRSSEQLLFRKELELWRKRFDIAIELTVDHAGPDWQGHVGTVTTLLGRIPFDARAAIALICGPEIMMRFTIASLLGMDLPEQNVYLSMERNMKCAVGFCGHCQFGPAFVCRDGPVFRCDRVRSLLSVKEF
jgi:NAD(P)H-flavin reductase